MMIRKTELVLGTLVVLFIAGDAMAATGGVIDALEGPLRTLIDSLTGPIAFGLALGATVAAGLYFAAGLATGGLVRLLGVAFAAAIVSNAETILGVFGLSGATF